jgi:hypothetical protein
MKMPWKTTYGARGADVRFTDRSDGEEVYEANREVYLHAYEDGFQYAIVDFSSMEQLDLPLADLLRIADYDRQYLLRNPPYLLAMIAPQAHVFGLARTYERYMEGSTLRSTVVTTRDEAIAWLNNEMIAQA